MPAKPAWFDQSLQKIVGLNRFGGLNIRVVFGQDPELLVTAFGERRAKYRAATSTQLMETKIGDGLSRVWEDKFDIGIPLWFAEVWIPPEEFGSAQHWERMRWKWINGVRTEVLNPYPTFGDYKEWLRFEHTEPGRSSYWGPNQRMLDVIVQGWKMMQEMKVLSVDDQIIRSYKDAARKDEEAENVLRPEFQELAKDWAKIIRQDFTVDQNPKGEQKTDVKSISGTTET